MRNPQNSDSQCQSSKIDMIDLPESTVQCLVYSDRSGKHIIGIDIVTICGYGNVTLVYREYIHPRIITLQAP
jgi:hypothetical protein